MSTESEYDRKPFPELLSELCEPKVVVNVDDTLTIQHLDQSKERIDATGFVNPEHEFYERALCGVVPQWRDGDEAGPYWIDPPSDDHPKCKRCYPVKKTST